MFFGYYEHTLDDKGRLMIPSKMREEVGRVAYILKGFDGALSVYREDAFMELAKKASELSFNKKSSRDYIRASLSSATCLEVDKVGRIQIPTLVLNKYGIGKEVVILGVLDHLEIWDKQAYLEYEKQANANFENNAESLE